MNTSEYIRESEHAVRQLFDGIAHYRRLLSEIPNLVFLTDVPFDNEESWNQALREWYEINNNTIGVARQKSRKYLGLSFSNATLCGSILQIASMAVELFSLNNQVPRSCQHFIKSNQKAVKFCIGREVRGLPLGIIIYAARNQYNHWDDGDPHPIMKAVFESLASGHGYGPVLDPAFDLSNPKLNVYSHNVLSLLEWFSYEDYEKDIRTPISSGI